MRELDAQYDYIPLYFQGTVCRCMGSYDHFTTKGLFFQSYCSIAALSNLQLVPLCPK